MWFYGTLLALFASLAVCWAAGCLVVEWLPGRLRPQARLFFAPLCGLALLAVLAALAGWSVGFPPTLTSGASLTLAALGIWRMHRLPPLWLAGWGALAGFSLLVCLWRYDAFDLFNDAFTYLVHGQWLQRHAFRELVSPAPHEPALTQVRMYQEGSLRMGGSFLLAWIQSAFRLDWSYQAYPVAMVLPMACGTLALAGLLLSVVRRSRLLAFALALLPALGFGGATFGALYGMLPQSYGLAFSFGLLALLGLLARARRLDWRSLFPVAFLSAGHLLCYPELLPFTLAASAVALARHPRLLLAIAAGGGLEWYRAGRSIWLLAGATVGTNVENVPWKLPLHALGLAAAPWEDARLLLVWPFALLVVAAAVAGWSRARRPWRDRALWPCWSFGVLVLAAWGFFRFVMTNPWDGSPGQPWYQFRIWSWAGYPLTALLAAGLLVLARQGAARRREVWLLAAVFLAGGAVSHYLLANRRTLNLREQTGYQHAPLDAYLDLRRLVHTVPDGEPIELRGFLGPRLKHRQAVAYFLMDRKLVSFWRDDEYARDQMPLYRRMPAADWAIEWSPEPGSPLLPRAGNLVLKATR